MDSYKEQLDVKIIDTVFDPAVYGIGAQPVTSRKSSNAEENKFDVRYYTSDEKLYHYKVWLFLSGNDVPFVESVTYQLHESFTEPYRTVNRSLANPDCRLEIWTWGIFQVNATITDKSGRLYRLSYQLNYGNLLEQYADRINYIQENPETSRGAQLIA